MIFFHFVNGTFLPSLNTLVYKIMSDSRNKIDKSEKDIP